MQSVDETAAKRTRLLSNLAQTLNQIAYESRLAVVLTNHVVSNINTSSKMGSESNGHMLIPALGESWSHAISNRLMLYWSRSTNKTSPQSHSSSLLPGEMIINDNSNNDEASCRIAEIVKSPCWPPARAEFAVCSLGIRDTLVLVRNNIYFVIFSILCIIFSNFLFF